MRTSWLGTSQIRWLSDLALFDFEIKYRAGKTNLGCWCTQAAGLQILIQLRNLHMVRMNGKPFLMIWFAKFSITICNSSKIPCQVKHKVQVNSADVREANSSVGTKISKYSRHAQLNQVKLFHSIPPSQMAGVAEELWATYLSFYEYV